MRSYWKTAKAKQKKEKKKEEEEREERLAERDRERLSRGVMTGEDWSVKERGFHTETMKV
jgi:hypothetical protein